MEEAAAAAAAATAAKEAKRLARNAMRRAGTAAAREVRIRKRAENAAAYTIWHAQRQRIKALADAVDMEKVGRNYAAAEATEDEAWQSKLREDTNPP